MPNPLVDFLFFAIHNDNGLPPYAGKYPGARRFPRKCIDSRFSERRLRAVPRANRPGTAWLRVPRDPPRANAQTSVVIPIRGSAAATATVYNSRRGSGNCAGNNVPAHGAGRVFASVPGRFPGEHPPLRRGSNPARARKGSAPALWRGRGHGTSLNACHRSRLRQIDTGAARFV